MLSPKPLAIVLDLPLPLAISVFATAVACDTSAFVGAVVTGAAGGGVGIDGLTIFLATPPKLSPYPNIDFFFSKALYLDFSKAVISLNIPACSTGLAFLPVNLSKVSRADFNFSGR